MMAKASRTSLRTPLTTEELENITADQFVRLKRLCISISMASMSGAVFPALRPGEVGQRTRS